MINADSINSARPLAAWVGGKRTLAKLITARIDAIPHRFYGEPFIGMGGIFFRRGKPAKVEAINDRARDVVNLFRVVRHHPEALIEDLRLQLISRADFQRLLKTDPDTLTDIQRAGRLLALMKLCYGGKPGSTSFPARRITADSLDAGMLRRSIEAVHDRLAKVTIEHLDFGEFLDRYDQPEALFYLDPPYWGCEDYYGRNLFGRADFERLAEQLVALKGRFLLSLNDVPEVRRIFGRFTIEEVPQTYRVGQTVKPVTELIISGLRR